jgi:flagellar basal body-associated protein FliL
VPPWGKYVEVINECNIVLAVCEFSWFRERKVVYLCIIILLLLLLLLLLTAIQFPLSGSSPYTSTDKTNNIHKRKNTKTQYSQYKNTVQTVQKTVQTKQKNSTNIQKNSTK